MTHFGPPGTPRGRPGPARAGTRVRGPSGVRKIFFSKKNNFFQKLILWGPGWFSGPQGRFWATWDPPKGPIWPQNAYKSAKMGPKNGLKTRKNRKILFCSKSLPEGSWMVFRPQKPKIDPPDSPMDPLLAHFVGILGHFGVKKTHFSRKNFFAPNHTFEGPRWSRGLKNSKLTTHTPFVGGLWTLNQPPMQVVAPTMTCTAQHHAP